MLRTMILLLLVALSAAPVAAVELALRERFDAWILKAFRPEALATVQGIRALDVPVSENVHEYQSPHAAHAMELREFVFHGLTIYAVVDRARPVQVWVTTIKIASPAWPLDNGLTVGQPVAELERLPVPPKPGILTFCGVNNCLVAEEGEGRIRSLTLERYLD